MKKIYINPNQKNYKNNKNDYSDIGILQQKIYEAQSHHQEFLLVGTDIFLWLQVKLFVNMVPCYMELDR